MNYALTDNDPIIDDQNRNYILKVKDLPDKEKPREKMLSGGPDRLSVAELLAIVLSVGTRKEEALTMSTRVLKEYGEKTVANQINPYAIQKDLDIPITKSCQIVACFELGRRFFQKNENGLTTVRTTQDASEYLQDMARLPKEHFRGLYLNSHFKIIHDEIISVGSLTSNIVHPREVFKPAIEYSAAAVIVAHNHPSGDKTPSDSDIATTKQLVQAGRILGIELLDHIIITKNGYTRIPKIS
ncbi:MAG: DNA repair protein RadC [Candidatus Moranbacteria bacterium]|nr:DNA repair protein RadC [Candidatus Moranbacteria bacterium]